MKVTWAFTPATYFENEFEIVLSDGVIKVGLGVAEITLPYVDEPTTAANRKRLDLEVMSRFDAVELLTHEPFVVHTGAMTIIEDDGHQIHYVELSATVRVHATVKADIQVIRDGVVTFDSKNERLKQQREIGELIAKFRSDPALKAMLRGSSAAVREPQNELVHLYEVRDAISKRFGGESEARKVLGVAAKKWSQFGLICNEEPVKQGRHRGKATSELRDASPAELNDARAFCRTLVADYVKHLQGAKS